MIDSLEAGGAEKMAVNYANALAKNIAFSGLVATRKQGLLKDQLSENVGYFFMDKKSRFDIRGIVRLKRYVVKNKVDIIHTHSTSFFTAVLLKITYPKVKIIWHDHYGNSMFLSKRPTFSLKIASCFFDGIIAVNRQLHEWSTKNLLCREVIYLPNFSGIQFAAAPETILAGNTGKRILCLANLREQKNHMLLLDVAIQLKSSHPDWTFHLVGKDFNDGYAAEIRTRINAFGLDKNVFLYGTKPDIAHILNQSDICMLTSSSEGLPLAILEYGTVGKPTVVTNVGELPNIILDRVNGRIVPAGNAGLFYEAVAELITDQFFRNQMGLALAATINDEFSEQAIAGAYIKWIKQIK